MQGEPSNSNKHWFESWFDTPYYHLLYNHRDFAEAEKLINNLVELLQPTANSKMLDLACGRGRHAYFLAQKGFDVTGADLSEKSISHAKETFPLPNLAFEEHDMREPWSSKFNIIFNLFTSFGYFDDMGQNQQVLQSVKNSLLPKGYFVFDYLNATVLRAQQTLVEKHDRGVITFTTSKTSNNNWVSKAINFEADGKTHHYKERVALIDHDQFQEMFSNAGLSIIYKFGDYDLNKFDPKSSPRLILIAQHK